MSPIELLKIAVENNLMAVQIGDNFPLHLLSYQERQELIVQAQENNIRLEAGTRGLSIDNLYLYLVIADQLNPNF